MNKTIKILFVYLYIAIFLVGCGGKGKQSITQGIAKNERLPIIDMHMHSCKVSAARRGGNLLTELNSLNKMARNLYI